MNKQRRDQIQEIIDKLDEIREDINMLTDEETEAWENLPEGIQCSERGEAMEAASEALQEAASGVEDVIDRLTAAQE